jgi:cysteine desulfurase
LRDRLYRELCEDGAARPACNKAVGSQGFLPNIVNVLVPGFESETLILQLDLGGFAVSGGSACSSGSLDPSHVLTAIGVPRDEALCSMRISMGWLTEEKDIDRFIRAFKNIVKR